MTMKKSLIRSSGSLPNLTSLTSSPQILPKTPQNYPSSPSHPLSSKPKILDSTSRKSIDIISLSSSPTSKSRKVIRIDTTKTPKSNSPKKFSLLGSFRLSSSPLIVPSNKRLNYLQSPRGTLQDVEGVAAAETIEASGSNFGSLNSPTGHSRTIMTPSIKTIKTRRKENQANSVISPQSKETKRPMSSIGTIGSPKKGKRSKSKGKRQSLDKLSMKEIENKEGINEAKIHLSVFETPQGSPQNSIPDQPDTPLYAGFRVSVKEPSNTMDKMSSPSLSPKHSTVVFSPRINFRKYEESLYRPKVSSMPNSPEASQMDIYDRVRGGSVIVGGMSRVSSVGMNGRRPSRILSKELEAKYGIKLNGGNDSEEDSEEESMDKVEVRKEKKKLSIREMIWGKEKFTKEVSQEISENEEEKKKSTTRRRRLQVKASAVAPKDDEFKSELKRKFENWIGRYTEGVKAGESEGRNTTREQEILLEQYKPMMVRMNEEGNKVVKPKFMKNMGTMCFTELWPRELRIRMQMMLEKKVVKKKREERLSVQKGRMSIRESQINSTADKRLKGDDQNLKSWREVEGERSKSPSFEKMKAVKSMETIKTVRTRASLSNVTSRLW